jgi:hypothetical protein
MERQVFITLAAIAVSLTARSEPVPNEELRIELLEMGRIDQDVRFRFMDRLNESGPSFLNSDEFRNIVEEQDEIDEANFLRLAEIVDEHGWPSIALVGEEANGAAWLILQHADLEQQKQYLPILREEVARNAALASNLAMLEDEIALADTGEQIYGTEIKLVDDNVIVAPVIDPARLDERRVSVGLPPMEEYLEEAEAEIGRPIDRSNLALD